MERECVVCGQSFTAERSSRRYCGSGCRAKASETRARERSGPARVRQLPGADDGSAPEPSDSVEVAVRADLEKAKKRGTVLGQQALAIARRLDHAMADSGSAVAALSKELTGLMAQVIVPDDESDALDEAQAKVMEFRRRRGA